MSSVFQNPGTPSQAGSADSITVDDIPAVVVSTSSPDNVILPDDAEAKGEAGLVRKAIAKGLRAAWENRVPGLLLPSVMAVMVTCYYIWPASGFFLQILADWKAQGGKLFAALASGFAGGILAQAVKVACVQGFRWNRQNTIDAIFTFLLFGFNGIIVAYLYQWQADFFGHEARWDVIMKKVMFDQFVFSVIWSTPVQSISFAWKECGFSWKLLRPQLNGSFVATNMLPMVIANWFFWIPMVTLVYALPTQLQFPLFLITMSLWSLILATVAKD